MEQNADATHSAAQKSMSVGISSVFAVTVVKIGHSRLISNALNPIRKGTLSA